MTSPLELITFADLVERVGAKHDAARESTSKAGWQRLLTLAESLAGQTAEDSSLTSRTWRLVRIRAQGYQGVPADVPLIVDLDPTPGITVLHGPNGSGKSSLADALDTALRGAPRPPSTTGTGGKAPLWERDHLARGAVEAEVEVVLADGPDRLVLHCRIGGAANVEWSARLHVGDVEREVALGDTWASALAGHQPVFGYAAVERRVQRANELQQFLEPLLAFGGCVDALEAALAEAAEPAQHASRRWEQALGRARTAVDAVDAERRTGESSDLVPVTWPTAGTARDQWLVQSGLQDIGTALPELTDADVTGCVAAAEAFDAAVGALGETEDTLQARLAVPLRQLLREAEARGEEGQTCPACTTTGVPWRERLTESLAALTAADEQRGRATTALLALKQAMQGPLQRVLAVLAAADLPEHLASAGTHLQAEREALLAALSEHGDQPVAAVRSRAEGLLEALQNTEVAAAIAEGRRQSERARQWRLARREALQPLLDVWAADAALAAEQPEWEAAKTSLRTLQRDLRNERAEVLREATGSAVQQLLSDSGVEIVGLTVSQREARLDITDATGQPVRLSMLSAGQRNAMLLAPLLRMRGAGPFGFLVLDDPVHAFDAVRIDRLAAILGRLAQDRRVVVLTHDERLREHLLVHAAHPDLRTVTRDGSGAVHVERSAAAWQLLLDDARAALDLDSSHQGAGRTDVVRGLCRMAVDDACRAALHAYAAAAGRDVVADLTELDAKSMTRTRLEHLETTFAGTDLADRARAVLADLRSVLVEWNRASHGNTPQSPLDAAEVDRASAACLHLVAIS
jgi:energy-coupling factor transporter ATP-binding protein EcfA2